MKIIKSFGLEPGAAQRMNPLTRIWEEQSPTLRSNMGDNQVGAIIIYDDEPVKKETVCLEGNGSRPSHMGNGYSVSDVMYTLNSIEVHGVAYEETDE